MKNSKLRTITECALLIAIGTILAQIKLFRLPYGGSVTAFSMLPFFVISYRHGTKWGLLAGFANAMLQIALGGLYPPPAGTVGALIASVMLDYVLAYMVLGLADLFAAPFKSSHENFAYVFGAAVCCFLRFLCAFLSGWLIWSEVGADTLGAVSYSIGYNGSYLLPESILTCLGVFLLKKYIPRVFSN